MNIRYYCPNWLLFSLLLLPNFLLSQSDVVPDNAFLQHYRAGEDFLAEKNLQKAINSFEKALQIKPDFASAYRRLGVAYELQKDFAKAAECYDECIALNPRLSRTIYFQSGEMHLKNGNYEFAHYRFKSFESYLTLPAASFTDGMAELETEQYFISQLNKNLEDSQFGLLSNTFKDIVVENLGPAINSAEDDCFPYLSNDENWMFYTRLGRLKSSDENLMYSSRDKGIWTNGKPLGEVINSEVNEGMGKATRDERLMYFPACDRADVIGVCDIFMAPMDNGEILETQTLKGGVNSEEWDSQPSINCDGQALYFVSNRPGGQGGTDIWVSYKQRNGRWGKATNLGPTINTPGDEEAPFIADDGVTLYFASNGHAGFGDQDIFFVKKQDNDQWGTPQNIGQPINSPNRELSFFLNARGNKGYVASNRVGGHGGLDIYRFELPDIKDFEEIAYVQGTVIDANTQRGVETTIYIDGKGTYHTDELGRFFVCYPTLDKLPISIDELNYYPYRKKFSLTNWEETGYVLVDVYLQPLSRAAILKDVAREIDVPTTVDSLKIPSVKVASSPVSSQQLYTTSDIYFYFDQYQLTQEARYGIDQLIEDIDPSKLALIIVEGYADQIGSDDYNQKLSEKRAEEVANYFRTKGLQKLKVTFKGYGETQTSLINSKNRRVDIMVYYKS